MADGEEKVSLVISHASGIITAFDDYLTMTVKLKDYYDQPLSKLLDEFFSAGEELKTSLHQEELDVAEMHDLEEFEMTDWEDMFEQDSIERRDPRLRGSIIEGEFIEKE